MFRKRFFYCLLSASILFCASAFGAVPGCSLPTGEGILYDRMLPDSASLDNHRDNHTPFFRRPLFLTAKYSGGYVLSTDKVLRDDYAIPYAQYWEMKAGLAALGNTWQDIEWGMPYYGIGFGVYDFDRRDMGTPLSIYVFQGATLKRFSDRLKLNYEWNLGVSFNWKVFDEDTNPTNECIGNKANVYISGNIYLSWALSDNIDLNVGGMFNHVSNGAVKMPNSGINTAGGYLELRYNFNRDRVRNSYNPLLEAPPYKGHFLSDFMLHGTMRQRKVNPNTYGLASQYVDHNFFVMGFSYALLRQPGHRFRYGLGLDLIYDESACFTPRAVGTKPNGKEIVEVRYGDMENRFSLGVSARGELVQSAYTIFALVGYNVIHGNKWDLRFYQQVGIKVPFWDNLYGTFSIRSKRFAKAQYLFFGMGYRLPHGKKSGS